MYTTRRQILKQGSAACILTAALQARLAVAMSKTTPVTLRDAGMTRGILAGCAVAVDKLATDPAYAELVQTQAAIVVAENCFKFGPMRPSPTSFFFDDADKLTAFAEAHRLKLRGHNFVWHRQLPDWFDGYVTRKNAQGILVEHIERVGSRYAGKIHSWDVVNEAILVEDGGLRNSPWQRLLPGYMDIAFRTARSIDPKALLVYNDYGIEGEDEGSVKKRICVMALLRSMQDRGIPIDALGIQSHIAATAPGESGQTYGAGMMTMIEQLRAMGLKVMITELDVNDRRLAPAVKTRDAAIAAAYGNYLHTVLANPAVIALLTWGITDKYTWLNGEDAREDKLPERPLPFDAEMKPKAAFNAMVMALQGAAKQFANHDPKPNPCAPHSDAPSFALT